MKLVIQFEVWNYLGINNQSNSSVLHPQFFPHLPLTVVIRLLRNAVFHAPGPDSLPTVPAIVHQLLPLCQVGMVIKLA